jgi:hypothetical protein
MTHVSETHNDKEGGVSRLRLHKFAHGIGHRCVFYDLGREHFSELIPRRSLFVVHVTS